MKDKISSKKRFLPLFIFFIFCFTFFNNALQAQAQEAEKKYGITWSGFVNVDYIFDSRQTVAAREGHYLLFPAKANFDSNGDDINATPNFNILAIKTRLKGTITGPDFFNMKTSGVIEGAFFGQSNQDVNGFRLRHAFVKLSGEKTELMLGQYWHPMFVTACFPGTYSFNTGAPFQPFSRNPQFRITTKGDLKFIGVLYSQRDFSSRGPTGTNSSYLRNSAIPGMHGQLQYSKGDLTLGAGANFKALRPSLTDAKGNKSTEIQESFAFLAYAKTKIQGITFKLESIYGQDMSDMLMLGGIAQANGHCTNVSIYSTWAEISGGIEHFEWGLFGGYSKNLGLGDPLAGEIFCLGGDIDKVFRVSPRLGWKSGKTKIGVELEFTSATYGSVALGDTEVNIQGMDPVNNIRLLVMALYSF